MKKCACVLLYFLLLGLYSCNVSSLEDPIVIADLEDEFVLTPWEILSPGERSLAFRIRSVATESCSNYAIDSPHYISGNKINVSIKDIVAPSACEPGIAPAGSEVDLGQVNTGIYGLRVDLKGTVVNEGQLVVNENSYNVQMFTENGIQFDHSRLRRVPDEAVWGYLDYSKTGDPSQAQKFITDLESITAELPLIEGYYGYFTQEEGGKISINDQPTGEYILPFVYRMDAASESFASLVDSYRDRYGETLDVVLLDADGQIY